MGIGIGNQQGLVHGLSTILSGLTEVLGGAAGQAAPAAAAPAAAPQQQAVGLPTQDQFQAAAPAGGAAPADGAAAPAGGDQIQQALGQLTQLLQQLVQLLGGGAAQGQGAAAGGDPTAAGAAGAGAAAGAPAGDPGTAVANAANGQTVTSVSPDGRAVATASATAGATASATATAGGAAAPAPTSDANSAAAAAAAAAAAQAQQGGGGLFGLFGGGGGDDPLMFDLDGKGAGFDTNKKVGANLNGKGTEQVNDLKSGTGLLTFDATPQDGAASQFDGNKGSLTHTFGNKTDLTAYGIKGDQPDGSFSNGFSALRAAGEHFGMIGPGKQYLDGNDLKTLESKIGLKMQVGGLNGQSKSLGDLGISRIDLGQANATESKAQGTRDANGNVLQHQQGANFTINGQQRGYVDGWFRPDGAAQA